MLVLTRKSEETVVIGDDIVIKVIKTAKGSVKIGIDAPAHVRVLRGELLADEKADSLNECFAGIVGGVLSDQYPHVA